MTFLTSWPDKNKPKLGIQDHLDAIFDRVQDQTQVAVKDQLPLLSGAMWPNDSRERGNVPSAFSAIVVEHDAGDRAFNERAMGIDEAAERLRGYGIKALLYTTPSHTPKSPRWRAICALDAPTQPDEHGAMVEVLNGVLDGVLADESGDLGRCWFYGRSAEADEYRYIDVPGSALDVAVLFAVLPRQPLPRVHTENDPLAGIERMQVLERVNEATLADLASALTYLADEGFGVVEQDWHNMGAACKSLGDRGLALWLDYSAAAPDSRKKLPEAKRREANRKWRHLRSDRTDYRAIFRQAQRLGWVNPRTRPATDAETVISKLRPMVREDVVREWSAMAAPLAKDAAHVVIDEVSRLTGVGVRALGAALKAHQQAEQAERRSKRTRERAGERKMVRERVEDRTAQAAEIDVGISAAAAPGEYVRHAGRIARIVAKQMPMTHLIDDPTAAPPATPQIDTHNDVSIRALVEREFVFHTVDAKGADVAQPVPHVLIDTILRQRESAARDVVGVLAHPIVLGDGTIVAELGHHKSGLYLFGDAIEGIRPFTQTEAAAALGRVEETLLSGFKVSSYVDHVAALAGLFTGVQRRILDAAPNLAILASSQGTGKTTLARRIHAILTGHDMPVATFPLGNEEEVQKVALSMLLGSPAMICFDNVPDGFTFRSGVLAALTTSPTFTGRILGATETVEVPTNTLFVTTGNNLRLGPDEVSRFLVCRLKTPDTRKFKHPDVVGHALEVRHQMLRDVVGIVAGFIGSGATFEPHPDVRYARWDRMVRQSLLWAGATDVGRVFESNSADAEHLRALRVLLTGLMQEFGDHSFYARDVVKLVDGFPVGDGGVSPDHLADALEALQAKNARSTRSVGRVLAAMADRQVVLSNRERASITGMQDRDGVQKFRVLTHCGV